MEQDKVSRLSDTGKNVWDEDSNRSEKMEQEKKVSLGQKWAKARATKKVVFWIAVGAMVLTIMVGFNWGGWVTGGTVQEMMSDAVVQRLSSICVAQYNQDPEKSQKLIALNEARSYQRDDYVREQGWATMPGDDKPDNNVSNACAQQLMQINQ
jgi:hypothetical protein